MGKTTITDVKAVIDTALSDLIIQKHIDIANRMVTANVSGLSADITKDIETYLTAHLIAIGKERQAMTEAIDEVNLTYQGKFGEGLKMTTYGQMVLTLDTTNAMSDLGMKKASIHAIRQVDPKKGWYEC